MPKVDMNEARRRLPELLDEGARGEEIVITAGGGATYTLTVTAHKPLQHTKRLAGLGKGNVAYISDDFDAELPDSFWLGQE